MTRSGATGRLGGAACAAGVDAVWIDVAGTGVMVDGPAPRHVVRRLTDVPPLLA